MSACWLLTKTVMPWHIPSLLGLLLPLLLMSCLLVMLPVLLMLLTVLLMLLPTMLVLRLLPAPLSFLCGLNLMVTWLRASSHLSRAQQV